MWRSLASLVTLLLALLLALPAFAQPIPAGEQPTPGVYNPTIGVAGDADASSIEKNPAQLGFLESWSGVYLHSELDPNGLVGGRGDGFFVASPVPYLTSLSVGAAVQLIRPPYSFPYANEEKLSLALAWRPLPALSIGLSYAHLWSSKPPIDAGLSTLDLAASARLGRYVAAGLVVHDLTSPVVAGLPLQRVYEPEIVVRPFGMDALSIALGARFGERRGDIDPRVRLWISPYHGLYLKSEVEIRRDVDLDGIAENDVRAAIGLEVDFEHFGVSGYGLFGSDEGKVQGHGFTVAARISGDRYPTVWAGPLRLEKVELGPGVTGRRLGALLLHLRRLERDRGLAGVVVVLGDVDGSWATAEELRGALLRLRTAGKHVLVYMAETNSRGYYIATAGERIYQDPAGGVGLDGLATNLYYFQGTGELLGIHADFVKIGEYKSAPEMFTRTSPSDPARAERNALLDDVYGNLVSGIAASRHVSEARVREWIDRGPYTAAAAQKAGLVDELRTGDEVESVIAERLGRHISIRDPKTSPKRDRSWALPKVAVLYLDGDLTDGKSYNVPLLNLRFVGLQTFLPSLLSALRDDSVKAIVLRVDSPGGSALASDLIAREVERGRAVKPIVCSLGDVAASGGYYVSAPCRKIFAEPSTVTGSIGIFSGKFDVSGLARKLGVHIEQFQRGTHATTESMFRPYTDEERAAILGRLRYAYDRFVSTVARGRGLTPQQVDAIGRGHIWSGRAAKARGLIDAFGGLGDAVAAAKELAGLHPDAVVEIAPAPAEPSLLSTLASWLGIKLQAEASLSPLDLAPGLIETLRALPGSLLVEPSVPQARLDARLELK